MSLDQYLNGLKRVPHASIKYTCSCGRQRPLEELYFCAARGCMEFLCNKCSQQVIDTYYCPCCLNSFFSSAAFQNKNRCQQCLQCPACPAVLASVNLPNGDFSFQCENCKWRSDSLGLVSDKLPNIYQDLRTQENSSPSALAFQKLLRMYGDAHKESKKPPHLEDLPERKEKKGDGTNDPQLAVRVLEEGLAAKRSLLWRLPKLPVENASARPHSDDKFALAEVCGLEQRFAACAALAPKPAEVRPVGVQLHTKVGHKCKRCTKFVVKPKAGATKVGFDVSNLALSVIPKLTVKAFPKLEKGKTTRIVVVFRNAVRAGMKLSLSQLPVGIGGVGGAGGAGSAVGAEDGVVLGLSLPMEDSLLPEGQPPTVKFDVRTTAKVNFLEGEEVILPPNNDPDYDKVEPEVKPLPTEEDAKVVAFRQGHKVGLWMDVSPEQEGEVLVSFLVNVGPADEGPGTRQLVPFSSFSFQAYLNLGPVGFASK